MSCHLHTTTENVFPNSVQKQQQILMVLDAGKLPYRTINQVELGLVWRYISATSNFSAVCDNPVSY